MSDIILCVLTLASSAAHAYLFYKLAEQVVMQALLCMAEGGRATRMELVQSDCRIYIHIWQTTQVQTVGQATYSTLAPESSLCSGHVVLDSS